MDPKPEPTPTPPTPAPAAPALPASAANFSRDELVRWKTHFGAAGADWYMDGTVKNFEEAALLFGRNLQTQLAEQKTAFETQLAEKDTALAALTTERDQLKAKTEFRRGHNSPARVDATKEGDAKTVTADPSHSGRTAGMNAFIGAIEARMPKTPSPQSK